MLHRALTDFVSATLVLGFFLCAGVSSVTAGVEQKPLHWAGKKTRWDRKRNIVELEGNAFVNKQGESLSADKIILNLNKRTIRGVGNCNYTTPDLMIKSEELHFHIDTSVGSVIKGVVTDGKFSLEGDRINKLSERRFLTHRGTYTTCRDCPGSWAFQGEDVDFEFGGYAYMNDVDVLIKGTPILWLPFLVIPLKSERESGFLFPIIGVSTKEGFKYVQPYFWNISRSADMTFGAGGYTNRGPRGEWEGRYALSKLSEGQANVFYQREGEPKAGINNDRWSLAVRQSQELPFRFMEKLQLFEVSDNRYPAELSVGGGRGDVPGLEEPALTSRLQLTQQNEWTHTWVEVDRIRNLAEFQHPTAFDGATVQQLPAAQITTNDQFFGNSPVAGRLTLGASNFSRVGDNFDLDPDEGHSTSTIEPGVDPIRKGVRASMAPAIYTVIRPFNLFSLVPLLEYREYYYSFADQALPTLSRGYLLFQTDISMQLQKIWSTEDTMYPKVKHLIRPTLRYSLIPYIHEPDHPFIEQTVRNVGYRFDRNDLIPLEGTPTVENYTIPLGHSLTYGVVTQWIRRRGDVASTSATYDRFLELRGTQTLDIRSIQNPDGEDPNTLVPLTRFDLTAELSLEKISGNLEYKYYPYLERIFPDYSAAERFPHEVSIESKYTFAKEVHQQILAFERSIALTYDYRRIRSLRSNVGTTVVYSLSDFVMPSASVVFDIGTGQFRRFNGSLTFQSPSRCWKATFLPSYNRGENEWAFDFQLSLNLDGQGFQDVQGFSDSSVD